MPSSSTSSSSKKKSKKLCNVKLQASTLHRLREFALDKEFGSKNKDDTDTLVNRLLDLQDTHVATQIVKRLSDQIRLYEAIVDRDRLEGSRQSAKFKIRR